MRLVVRFEQGARDLSGVEEEIFYLPAGTHASELKRHLGDIYVVLRDRMDEMHLTVNGERLRYDRELRDGDEIVFTA